MSVSEIEAAYWDMIRKCAGKYPPQAFQFVQEGLRHTVERMSQQAGQEKLEPALDAAGEPGRHVNGQQLCIGLRDYAIEQYGLLARTVLGHWNIRRTEDFGRLVFLLVEAGLLRKTEEDSAEDFAGVYCFDEVFGRELERC